MLPLIPFIAGAAAGVAATELWRRGKVQSAVQAAGGKLRASAASGLESVRQSSANLRETVADALHDKWQALRGGKHGQEQAGQADPAQPAVIPALPAPEDQARQPAKADKAARPGARKPRAAGKRAAKPSAAQPAASAAEASAPEAASEPARAAKPARRRPPRKKAAAPDSAAE